VNPTRLAAIARFFLKYRKAGILTSVALDDPLFAGIEPLARPFLDGTGYLSWAQLRDLADHPLVTLEDTMDGAARKAAELAAAK